MSIDTAPAGEHTAADGTRIHLDPRADTADETLIAWRQAAVTGGLPEPSRRRWQQLRAGVVNMWEFDAAEYWSAHGRAQFVGRNEQGKSTMMAMTTLTMLTGDLSPRFVDTFGESHRTFRYYLEPTDDPKDRRPTDSQLNRGWTWVEYGRVTDTGPEYFTTLLFVQARRTSVDYTKKWITHTGPERVRAGITLLHQNAIVTAADLTTQPGLTVHPNGRAYAKTVAATLFGLTDPERLRTVVELLKTLRTPKLGNRLEPGWVIDRIREALPPLDTGEISELAEGWDQLGQLAADRDAAREAKEAVTAYVRSTWNPWADATLRLAADDLVAAVTVHDDVTRSEREARSRATVARTECDQVRGDAGKVDAERDQAAHRRETLLQSQAYRAAADAGRQVTEKDNDVRRIDTELRRATSAQQLAHQRRNQAATVHERSETDLTDAKNDASEAAAAAGRAASTAGLPADSVSWAASGDTARLETAIAERRGHVREAGRLDQAASRTREVAARDLALLTVAQKDHEGRRAAAEKAATAFDGATQQLSDALERWAETLTGHDIATPPPVTTRERWLDVVLTECGQQRPVARLTELIHKEWTQPAVAPLETKAATADHDAATARTLADDLDAEADRIESEPTLVPPSPHHWDRRTRPASGPDGAPLWELLDPVETLDDATLAGLEAALAGAGLLDAWVTTDGVWAPDRDGHDHVVTLTDAPTGSPTLRSVLTLAEPVRDDGPLAPLADTAGRVLDTVGWSPTAGVPGPDAGTWVAADGSWRSPTTSGRALVPETGARLLGATARAADRARRVAARRGEAAEHRARADELTQAAERHRDDVAHLRDLGEQAPDDADVLDTARDRATTNRELDKAQTILSGRERDAEKSEIAAAEANATLLRYCSDKHLDPARLPAATEALDQAAGKVRALADAAAKVTSAAKVHQIRSEHLDQTIEQAAAADAALADLDQQLQAAQVALQAARDALEATDQDLLDEVTRLATRIGELAKEHKKLTDELIGLAGDQATAEAELAATEEKRRDAEIERSNRLDAWWVPVDAGLAAARGVPAAEHGPRSLTAALAQARGLRAERRPPRSWPETPGSAAEREQIVSRLRDNLAGPELTKLNNTLNRTGGRSALIEHDETTGLPQVQVLVDASNARFDPVAAIEALDAKNAQLGELHDEQMHKVMEELLASTFVDHLRDKIKQTEALLRDVNDVLVKHPTGTTRTVLRLHRKPVAEHAGGYQVLNRLLEDAVDSPEVQRQVQAFLSGQIRAAQDEGHAEGRDWKELLVDKLDYRRWFAVVTEWRVLQSAKEGATLKWQELTRERHAKDSGGGKVMTMLQPLLATLATLYQNSPTAPRPLWLDEAFDGVDAQNTNSLLGMLVDFDLDFVLAGPKALVVSRHVPAAAVWMVNRAPAPMPGVDLGLWLYAAGTGEKLQLGEQTWATTEDAQGDAHDTEAAGDAGGEEGTLWA